MIDLTLLEMGLLLLAGLAAGFINVTAGGGSMLTLPAMIFVGIPGPIANATNRIGIVAQNIAAVRAFHKKGFSDFGLSLSLALCTLPGAIFGAYSAAKIRASDFNYILAGVMLIVMALTLFSGQSKAPTPVVPAKPSRARLIWGHICMLFVGLWGGFIQIGVGFILIPILHRVMGFDLVRTNMHKVLIVLIYTIAALIVFASQIEIVWLAGLFLAAGMMAGATLAAAAQIKRGTGYIKWVLNAVLLVFIVKLVLFS